MCIDGIDSTFDSACSSNISTHIGGNESLFYSYHWPVDQLPTIVTMRAIVMDRAVRLSWEHGGSKRNRRREFRRTPLKLGATSAAFALAGQPILRRCLHKHAWRSSAGLLSNTLRMCRAARINCDNVSHQCHDFHQLPRTLSICAGSLFPVCTPTYSCERDISQVAYFKPALATKE